MKKVLVLAAAVTLFAAPAMAVTIVGSAHDLSGKGLGVTEICAFCHTPHGGGTSAPLWNRANGAAPGSYGDPGGSMDHTPGTAGDVMMCMSCHDGSVNEALTNYKGAATTPTAYALTGINNLGTLTNDHPVGFTVVDGTDTAIDTIANINAAGGATLKGTGNNELWCSSCHNVHDPGAGATFPFLRDSNAASALCLDCHIK